jgi:hypothetical protein
VRGFPPIVVSTLCSIDEPASCWGNSGDASGWAAEKGLSPQTELGYERLIAGHVVPLQVTQQPSSLPYEHHETPLRMKIVTMQLHMLSQAVDSLSEDGYLDLCRAGVLLVGPELLDDCALFLRLHLLLHLILSNVSL